MTANDNFGLHEVMFTTHPKACGHNSPYDILQRIGGRCEHSLDLNITGTGAITANVFQLYGSVVVLDQWAIITSVTTLTNATAVYGDLWDGTNSEVLTQAAPGATLSGAPVGTMMRKDQLKTAAMTVSLADQCRTQEMANRVSQPFTITQKNGADTYVRFHLTTTDAPIDFDMDVYFTWAPLDGGYIEAV